MTALDSRTEQDAAVRYLRGGRHETLVDVPVINDVVAQLISGERLVSSVKAEQKLFEIHNYAYEHDDFAKLPHMQRTYELVQQRTASPNLVLHVFLDELRHRVAALKDTE